MRESDAPLASCIMPTANRRRFVPGAIARFLAQDWPARELIILDDGADAVADLVPEHPAIRYIRTQRHGSLGTKRNAACAAARGDIILHWDDDDWYAPHRVRAQVEALRDSGADVCGIDRALFLDPDTPAAWEYVYPPGGAPWVCGATLCYRRAFWHAHPFADTTIGEDTMFAAAVHRDRLHVLPDITIFVGLIHNANTSRRQTRDPRWQARPLQTIEDVIGPDWTAYAGVSKPGATQAATPIGGNASGVAMDGGRSSAPTKIQRQRVSVVIPHGGEERLPHLAACLANLAQCGGHEIIVVDMSAAPTARHLASRWGAKYVFTRGDGPFERARALNVGSQLSTGDLVLWMDNDLLAPRHFLDVAAVELQRRGLDFLIPYSSIDYVTEGDSASVMAGVLDPARCRIAMSLVPGRMVSGGAGLVRKQFLCDFGGIPEGFRGWGGEDNAWVHKAGLFGRSTISSDRQQRLWHLYHPTSGAHDPAVHRKNPHYNENLRLLDRVCAVADKRQFLDLFPVSAPSCPWDRSKRIAFVEHPAGTLARAAADGLKALLAVDVTVIAANQDARWLAELADAAPDAVVVFDAACANQMIAEAGLAALRDRTIVLLGPETKEASIEPANLRRVAAILVAPQIDRGVCCATIPVFTLPADPATAVDLGAIIAQPLSLVLGGAQPAAPPGRDRATGTGPQGRVVWTYWEGECPEWIAACRRSIGDHAPDIRQLDREAFDRLRDTDRDIDIDRLEVAHRADFIRAFLLARYGGLWLDSDCIALKPLAPLLDMLDAHDFMAHRDRQGYFPNGFIGARKGSLIAAEFYRRICGILRSGQRLGWISLGGEPLTDLLKTTDVPWRELPCELIQPVCWSRPEVFFAVADRAEHERSYNDISYCYMLSNTEIRKHTARHPESALMREGSFFRFLLEKSAASAVPEQTAGATPEARSEPLSIQSPSATEQIFRKIYRENTATGDESVSGPGSCLAQTTELRRALPLLLQGVEARSLLDAPCGDFNWMKHVELGIEQYIGVDIVNELVSKNRRNFSDCGRQFIKADIIQDDLPNADVIMCRDCLVHLSFREIQLALQNFKRSGATYVLTTTFPKLPANEDIVTGQWRPLNLQLAPFNFPVPIRVILEGCTEAGGRYADKSLALWRLGDVRGSPL